MKNKIPPPTYFIIFLLLSLLLNFVFPVKKLIYAPYTVTGIILILFGIALNIWADNLFKKYRTTVKPHQLPTALVIKGPFKITRNPMYLGMAAILSGVSIFFGTLIVLLIPIFFIILMELLFIPEEEKNMEISFGNKYRGYKKKVRRWI